MKKHHHWRCQILYFSQSLIKKCRANHPFMHYCFQEAWNQSYNCRRQFENNIFWEKYLNDISQSNRYITPKVCCHLKQLFLIAENIFPGMVFSSSKSEQVAPIKTIQQAYLEIYRLKHYAPILMHPQHILDQRAAAVYYSLNYPNYFDAYLPTKTQSRLMDELVAIQETLKHINEYRDSDKKPSFLCFHAAKGVHRNIFPAQTIVTHEKMLSDYFKKNKHLDFPSNSIFFKGCIRLSM